MVELVGIADSLLTFSWCPRFPLTDFLWNPLLTGSSKVMIKWWNVFILSCNLPTNISHTLCNISSCIAYCYKHLWAASRALERKPKVAQKGTQNVFAQKGSNHAKKRWTIADTERAIRGSSWLESARKKKRASKKNNLCRRKAEQLRRSGLGSREEQPNVFSGFIEMRTPIFSMNIAFRKCRVVDAHRETHITLHQMEGDPRSRSET